MYLTIPPPPLVERFIMHQSIHWKGKKTHLVVKRNSTIQMGAFLLVVTRSLHHVLWVTEQGQVHQLVIQAVLLIRETQENNDGKKESKQKKEKKSCFIYRYIFLTEAAEKPLLYKVG